MPEVQATMTALEWCFEDELSHVPGWRSEFLQMEHSRDTQQPIETGKIVARAATTKNRKEAVLHLHRDVAEQLQAFLAGREIDPEEKVFEPLLRLRGQFKSDLRAAGISPKNAEGRVVDFHSLRHTFCTNLQRLNVPLRLIMLMMRHSDRRLSDQTYTDTSLLPADETVQLLTVPGMSPSQNLSHIASQELVPAGQNGPQAVTAAEMLNGSHPLMNTGVYHALAPETENGAPSLTHCEPILARPVPIPTPLPTVKLPIDKRKRHGFARNDWVPRIHMHGTTHVVLFRLFR